MALGVKFGDIHSSNLGLILTNYEIKEPQPKTQYVNIPFANGSVDISEAFGEIKYTDREIIFEFKVINRNEKEQIRQKVVNALNGKKLAITLDNDQDYYYIGRLSIPTYKGNKSVCDVEIRAICNTFKLKQNITTYTLSKGYNVIENGNTKAIPRVQQSLATNTILKLYGKNLCQKDYDTITFNRVDLTQNADGSYHIRGVANGTSSHYMKTTPPLIDGVTYVCSGTCRVRGYFDEAHTSGQYEDFGAGRNQKSFVADSNRYKGGYRVFLAYYTANQSYDKDIYPQLEIGEVPTSFEKASYQEIDFASNVNELSDIQIGSGKQTLVVEYEEAKKEVKIMYQEGEL